ncbi:MAG: SufB/SufD family protein [Solirubrobacteraceae bacterium]
MAKPGAAREASLYQALAGAGSHGGVESIRAQAREAFERLELPTWRRSGFWTTTLRDLDLDALEPRKHEPDATPPELLDPTAPRAGVLVQRDSSVVHVELDPDLRARGVLFCSLEDAPAELRERYFMQRLTFDRDKLSAASAAFWSGGAFLYVPPDVNIEHPLQVVYEISGPGSAQYAHTLAIGDRGSQFVLHEYDVAEDFEGQALHAGQFELYLEANARCRLAQLTDWGAGDVHDASTSVVTVARDAYCHWLPMLLGGKLIRHHDEIAVCEPGGDMAFRGIFFAEAQEHLDVFAVDLHEAGPSGGDVHWRGAATGASRASFEGLIQIYPGAQQTHTYLQIHTMLLSPDAKLDAIPSVLVSADDVSASHGGTVGELDEALIFYMQARGLSRPQAVRVIVEAFFEPLIVQLEDPALEALARGRIGAKLAAAAADIEQYALAR